MKRTGEIVLLNGVVAPALNVFGQVAIPTALSPGASDGFLLLGAILEFSDICTSAGRRQTVISRASKAAIPTVLDDDVMLKDDIKAVFATSGLFYLPNVVSVPLPPQALIVVESNIYVQFQTIGNTIALTCSAQLFVERVELTDKEKSAILSQRLNNLLN